MTKKENFILLSLDDENTKDVANAVSSKTGKKIIEFLEKEEKATESEISSKLKIAPSTVNYTIEQLSKAGLIENTHFHYSQKGKEVKHWALANKLIIIAPKKTQGLFDKIKDLIPAFFLTGFGALSIYFSSYINQDSNLEMTQEITPFVAKSRVVEDTSTMLISESNVIEGEPNIALWFFIGAISALILVFLYRVFEKKLKKYNFKSP